MRALAFVLGAALLQSAAAAYVRPPCELNKTRAGFDILSATLPADGNRITIVQCGDTPIERPNFNLLRTSDFRTISYGMQSVYLNAAYAALHGYKYEFYVVDANGTFGRNPSWCRVPAVKRALKARHPPEATLYIDLDAYIRTDKYLSLDALKAADKRRAVGMDEGYELYQGIYWRVKSDPPLNRSMTMPQLQVGFETDPAWVDALQEIDMLNTGGGWLEINKGEDTMAFLDAWWDLGSTFKGGQYMNGQYFDQRILSVLMAEQPELRAQTALLEDTFFNSPTSPCMVHMFANLKGNDDWRRTMTADLLERLELAQSKGREINIKVTSDDLLLPALKKPHDGGGDSQRRIMS